MFRGVASDRLLMYEKQEQENDYLSKIRGNGSKLNKGSSAEVQKISLDIP